MVRDPLSPSLWGLPLVLAVTAAVYWPALHFQFVFDDRVQIAANPSIYWWSHVPDYFRGQIWGFAHVWTSYYRPLFLLAFRTWHSLVGLDTMGWHVFPILVHLLNIALGYALARKLTGDKITALIAAGLFAVHPVQLESVACIYGMTDALMASYLFGGFLCYLKFRENGRWLWLAATLVFFVCGLLTKESAIVFPIVLVAFELSRSKNSGASDRRIILPGVISLALVAAYLVVRRMVLGVTLGATAASVSWSTVLYTAPMTLLRFLRLLIAPYGMSSFFDFPYVTRPDLHFLVPALVLILIAGGIWMLSRKTNDTLIGFCAAWAVLAVLPVLNIRVMQEGDFVHIRFLYLPCFAVSLLAAVVLQQIFPNLRLKMAIATACFAALAIGSAAQIGYFESNVTVYRRGIDIAPDNRVPKNNLADDYIKQDRDAEAQALLEDVLRRHPDFWMANYNLGYIAYKRGDWAQVADYMERSLENHGEEVDAYAYRAYALLKLGRVEEAERSVREAIALRPAAKSYHFVLGLVLRQEQRWPDALAAFQRELEIDPRDSGAKQHVADLKTRLAAGK